MNHVRPRLLPKRCTCPPGVGSHLWSSAFRAGHRCSTSGAVKEQGNQPGTGRLCFSHNTCKNLAVSPDPFPWLHPTSISNLSLASNQLHQLFFGHGSPPLPSDHHSAPFPNLCLYPIRASRAPSCSWRRGLLLPQPTNLLCPSAMSLPEFQQPLMWTHIKQRDPEEKEQCDKVARRDTVKTD